MGKVRCEKENTMSQEPFDFGRWAAKWWARNKIPTIIIGAFCLLAFMVAPYLKDWEDADRDRKNARRLHFEAFVNETLGALKIVDHYWDHSGTYGGHVSVDVSKPMILVKCRQAKEVDPCWVVQEVDG